MKEDIILLKGELEKMHTVMHTMEETIKSFECRFKKINGEVSGLRLSISEPSTPEKVISSVTTTTAVVEKVSTPVTTVVEKVSTPVATTTDVNQSDSSEEDSDDDSDSIIVSEPLSIKLKLPENTCDFGLKFHSCVLDGKTHVLFAGFEDESKKLSGFDNLTEYHYCVSLSNGHDEALM